MKTAEELWKHYSVEDEQPDSLIIDIMTKNDFLSALTEHDKEIISKIEELKNWDRGGGGWGNGQFNSGWFDGYRTALTELKQFMEEKK